MEIYRTARFKKQYKKMPQSIKQATDKQLGLLLFNPKHPSSMIKKMNEPHNIWEARITESYRFTFQKHKNIYILRNIGTHDILKKP